MIASYADRDTERVALGIRVKKFEAIAKLAQRKLAIIRAASTVDDLSTPPGNRLEALAVIARASTALGSMTSTASALHGRRSTHTMLKSSITTRKNVGRGDLLPLVTPGEVLYEEFLQPFGLSANALAIELRVPANRIQSIVKGQRAITADTALRLAQYFGNSPEFWLNLQKNYELDLARREKLAEIQAFVPRRQPANEDRVQVSLRRRQPNRQR